MNIIFQLRVLFIRTVNESFEPSDAGFLVHRYSETELEEGLIDFETLSINSESDSPYCLRQIFFLPSAISLPSMKMNLPSVVLIFHTYMTITLIVRKFMI